MCLYSPQCLQSIEAFLNQTNKISLIGYSPVWLEMGIIVTATAERWWEYKLSLAEQREWEMIAMAKREENYHLKQNWLVSHWMEGFTLVIKSHQHSEFSLNEIISTRAETSQSSLYGNNWPPTSPQKIGFLRAFWEMRKDSFHQGPLSVKA